MKREFPPPSPTSVPVSITSSSYFTRDPTQSPLKATSPYDGRQELMLRDIGLIQRQATQTITSVVNITHTETSTNYYTITSVDTITVTSFTTENITSTYVVGAQSTMVVTSNVVAIYTPSLSVSPTTTISMHSPSNTNNGGNTLSTGAKAGIGIGAAVGGLALLGLLGYFLLRRRNDDHEAINGPGISMDPVDKIPMSTVTPQVVPPYRNTAYDGGATGVGADVGAGVGTSAGVSTDGPVGFVNTHINHPPNSAVPSYRTYDSTASPPMHANPPPQEMWNNN
ncbi:MAG: hypothetical protein M1827_004067 [Pycnora praestabilis]|nr:MAG: hypothetical protein M1827_004067 [Pycnora praestabilis]